MGSGLAALWLGLLGGIGGLPAAQTPELALARYETAAALLEAGGDLYVIKDADGRLQSMVQGISGMAAGMPGQGSDDARYIMAHLDEFLSGIGAFDLHTVAASTVPRGDGLRSIKLFLGRTVHEPDRPLWQGLCGGAPHRPRFLPTLPASTVLALEWGLEPDRIWEVVRQAMLLFGCQGDEARLATMLGDIERKLDVGLPDIFGSLGSGLTVSVQFDNDKPVALPLPGGMYSMPTPGFLVVAPATDDSALEFILQAFENGRNPLAAVESDIGRVYQMRQPLPAPFAMQIAAARIGGKLLLASTPQALRAAVAPAGDGQGLGQRQAFRDVFASLPAQANAWFFCDSAFRKTLGDALKQVQQMPLGNNPMGVFTKLFQATNVPAVASGWTMVNRSEGVWVTGTGSGSFVRQLASGNAAMPGMMAAIAVPSFMRARSTAQNNACRNMLRQIDGAKEQWALAHNKPEGATPTAEDLSPYLKGGFAGCRCPQGGTYQINPIGQKPTCTIPGHRL